MKYIAYNRKSTDESNNQILSLETQRRITDEIARTNNLHVVDTIEEKRSAKISGNRPAFTSILSRIRDGEIQGIIVAHADRLARNERELADILELFDQGFLKEIRIQDRVYKNYNDFHDIARDLVEAAHYSRNLSARVKEGNESKLLRGEFLNRAPIGYSNREAKIYPDPQYAPYITFAFNTYSTGSCSLKALTKLLNDRGMRSRYKGNLIQKSTVHGILTNPVYYGAIRVHKRLYKGIHEPLISIGLFNLVQDVLNGKNIPKVQKHNFIFRGYVVCSVCGASYTASIKKDKYIYYYCTNSKGICLEHKTYLDESDLIDLTCDLFRPYNDLRQDFVSFALDVYINDLKINTDTSSKIRDELKKKYDNNALKTRNLLDVLLDNTITKEVYEEKLRDLNVEKSQLELQISSLKPIDPRRTMEQLELLRNKAVSIQNMFMHGDNEVRGDLLKSALWNFSVKGGNVTSYRFKTVWELLEKGVKSADFKTMYPVPDSNRRLRG